MRAVEADNLRGFQGIRRVDRVPNARINELWFGHVERMENDRIAKRVCRRVC